MFTSRWFKYTNDFIESTAKVKQVYVWIFDKDKNMLIVSKDGVNWQLPGGKPNVNETLKETAIREVFEETGLDIDKQASFLKVFGYYEVSELDEKSGAVKDRFIQVRMRLDFDCLPEKFSTMEPEDIDHIKFIKKIKFNDIASFMPWMLEKQELGAVS